MDAPVAGETLVFEGWRFDARAGDLLREGPDGVWVTVAIGTRARNILALLLQRPNALVSKDAIMDAAWPNVTVEPNNLTVQIAALRRILDEGRTNGSCIETVPGRGYRFVPRVGHQSEALPDPMLGPVTLGPVAGPQALGWLALWPPRRVRLWSVAACAAAMAALLAVAAWPGGRFVGQSSPPRLSLVVLPFQNLSGSTADDYLADGITDDLTTELAHIVGARVVARETARNLKRQADDVRAVGKQLGVRYVIEGGVRRLGRVLHANVRLVSVETAENLWSDRLDEAIGEGLAGQEHIVMRMGDQLAINMVEIESARSLRERPTNPDAFDLILRARSIRHLPESPQRNEQVRTLSERALALDPTSLYAMTDVAYALTDAAAEQGWASLAEMERAGRLLDEARARAPAADFVLNTYVFWLRTVGRCPETIELAQRALEAEPKRMRVWTGIYNELATCKLWAGHADQALALHAEADRLNPYSPWKFVRYHQMGKASLLLGREQDGIAFLERAIAMNRNDQWAHRWLAAAYALAGRVDEAKRSLGEANRLWPYNTVRGFSAGSNAYAVQTARFREALRLAGERDHADEDADFGLPPDGALHNEVAGRTPVSVLGASTIRTAELAHMIAESRPVIVDTMSVSSGQSIRGAVGLKFAGLGGSLDDAAQVRLARKMRELTAGDLGRPIVAVGWNSERFDGRNLALRLVALGYTHVYWYRSGREAWEVAGLPEGPLNAQEW